MAQPSSGFQVRPDELSAASAAATGIAARLPAQAERLASATSRSADQLSGWRTADALRTCGEAWHALLDRLHRELTDQSGKLDSTAQRYRAGERSAAEGFRIPAARTQTAGPPPVFGPQTPPYTALARP
jgi:hypothetical protein